MPEPPTDPAVAEDIEWCFPRHAPSVSRARALFREQAAAWKLPDEATEVAVLLLSELMTNAVRPARVSPGCEVSARCVLGADCLTASVTDTNDRMPTPREASPDDESGRGPALVAALADDWGAEPRPGGVGKVTWFVVQAGP